MCLPRVYTVGGSDSIQILVSQREFLAGATFAPVGTIAIVLLLLSLYDSVDRAVNWVDFTAS